MFYSNERWRFGLHIQEFMVKGIKNEIYCIPNIDFVFHSFSLKMGSKRIVSAARLLI